MSKNYYVFVWGVKKDCANIRHEVCFEIKVIDECLKVKFPSFLPSKYHLNIDTMIHLSSVLFVYFLLYFEQKNYVKQYNNIQDEVYLTIPKSKKTHLKTGFWKLEFMEQQAEIAAKRRQITGRFEEKYIHTALTLPN